MKGHKRRKSGFFLLMALLLCAIFVSGCTKKDSGPIPPAGTRVISKAGTSDVFKQTAKGLQQHCQQIGGCTCFLDGNQTTCAVVFACLDAGFCEVAKAPN